MTFAHSVVTLFDTWLSFAFPAVTFQPPILMGCPQDCIVVAFVICKFIRQQIYNEKHMQCTETELHNLCHMLHRSWTLTLCITNQQISQPCDKWIVIFEDQYLIHSGGLFFKRMSRVQINWKSMTKVRMDNIQNGWFFGKVPNGLWPPPHHFRKIMLRIS